jgi:hypothetical protein
MWDLDFFCLGRKVAEINPGSFNREILTTKKSKRAFTYPGWEKKISIFLSTSKSALSVQYIEC